MIGLAYLVWPPLGVEPLREFLDSYRAHPPEVEHELTLILNGANAVSRRSLLAELDSIEHRLFELERPVLDLSAYGAAARQSPHSTLCLVNSYSVALVDGWLRLLVDAFERPGVGIAGATGSWESQAEWIRGKARYWPYQLARLRGARRDYPRFPNPHIRTTGLVIARDALLEMGFESVATKRDAYLLESGHASMTRHVLDRGERAVVVGRDGSLYDVKEWPASHTFRSGQQENLLISDNRTRDWERASPRLRRRLSRDAWNSSR